MSERRPRLSAGIALIEVMVTLTLLAWSATAWWSLLQRLSEAVSTASIRDAAANHAQNRLETRLNHITSTPENPTDGPHPSSPSLLSWTQLASSTEQVALRGMSRTARLDVRITDTAAPQLKSVAAEVSWPAGGATRTLTLHTLASGVDPRLPAVAALVRGDMASSSEDADRDEAETVPPIGPKVLPRGAVTLNGRHALIRPVSGDGQVWLIDRLTAEAVQSCWVSPSKDLSTLKVAHLEGCTALSGWWLSGHVRFAETEDATPDVPKPDPAGTALPLNLTLKLTDAPDTTPRWQCMDDAPENEATLPRTRVRFHCLVQAWGSPATWSGRLDIVPQGWTLGTSATDRRVCRYSADHNRNGRIDNTEHPEHYVRVDTPLDDQNFLIVPGHRRCPTGTWSARSLSIDLSTQPHQPALP